VTRIAIVDDEMLVAEQIERQIVKFGYVSAGIATSYEEAIDVLENNKPDLLLLDTRFNGTKTGVEIANIVNERFGIPFIFLSSHLDPASLQRAKLTRPSGYLTKPYLEKSLFATIEISLFNSRTENPPEQKLISFSEGKRTVNVAPDEIFYLEADHVYVKVVTTAKVHLVRKALNEILGELPVDGFLRVHRSFIVNLNRIEETGAAYVKVNGQKIPVGRTYREQVRSILSL
jgi:DNA-binding LytR/AlgR family response regulator